MHVKYIVELTAVERESLQTFVSSGSKLARKVKRAQILLAADQGYQDRDIAELVGVGTSTIFGVLAGRAATRPPLSGRCRPTCRVSDAGAS